MEGRFNPLFKNARKAEAAFWRSAVWPPTEAARAADRFAGIGPTDATLPIGMETALSMARLLAEVDACGGTPTKRASALLAKGFPRSEPDPGNPTVQDRRGLHFYPDHRLSS